VAGRGKPLACHGLPCRGVQATCSSTTA
jgi:hypothetical protein